MTQSKQEVELQDLPHYLRSDAQDAAGKGQVLDHESLTASIANSDPPEHAVSVSQRWNGSRSNVFKTMSTFLGFIVMGANDAAYGAILPYLQRYYDTSYTVVSLVFLSPFVGYIASATTNNLLHKTFGQRGIAIIGPTCHIISYIVICTHPPFGALVVVFILAGYGNGVLDAAWNSWIGNLANPNELLGFLHGFYGLGAVISPLVATTMITRGGLEWYTFYYIMIAAAVLELAASTAAFWDMTGLKFRQLMSDDAVRGATRAALKTRVAWIGAVFLLVYVGIEVALGGWIVEFMIQVRDGQPFESGMVATGFWLGLTVGRFILGFITPRLGENLSIFVYLLFAMAMQLLFWLVPQFIVSSVAAALVGFFLGPLFPAVVVAITKLLPPHLHVATVGFAAASGGGGACILPFAVGAIAQKAGVRVLQPIILAMLALALLLWTFGMPKISGKEDAKNGKLEKAKGAVSRAFYGCFSARL
ncbi:Bypass of stop codon protein 6 [Cyphellophora attinorum]|uniref:Bypass of stop codon protein 6 n=1 Tax=Cyphellophora attinorum TaxID=1664694 RepID=A0A0N1NZH7_9EURO|nr:Bypass of stop codon protein 6 [Phialophora attinorum]KPI40594.1 Bypass of stop codon protein 6 [Phialophora attinorum]